MTNKVVVVIPIHSEFPSEYELISFQQCFKILNNYTIKIIAPEGFNLAAYKKHEKHLDIIYIPEKWQSSLIMYNKLKLSKYFYNLFKDFDFLLTYELDAFVFSDDLQYWCEKGYDYIGAPWFEGYENPISDNFSGVGNSGFSLRRVKSMKKALDVSYKLIGSFFKKNILQTIWNRMQSSSFMGRSKRENNTIQELNDVKEDWFIYNVIGRSNPWFKIAPAAVAMKFSFEVNPKDMFKMNENKLPMGCHAWFRYDIEFWKPFIEKFGYSLKTQNY